MATINNEILDRLKKIQNLANRAGTLHEAEVASAMLSKLLLQNNISMRDLDDIADQEKKRVTHERFYLNGRNNWRRDLVYRLALANLCRALQYEGRPYMVIIGHDHNLIVVKEMYLWLSEKLPQLAKEAHKAAKLAPFPTAPQPIDFGLTIDEVRDWNYHSEEKTAYSKARYQHSIESDSWHDARYHGKTWVNSFLVGAVSGVCEKMREERDALKNEVTADQYALVPVIEQEVEDYMNSVFNPKTTGGRRITSPGAYKAGQAAGRDVNTARQVNSGLALHA